MTLSPQNLLATLENDRNVGLNVETEDFPYFVPGFFFASIRAI